MKIYLLTVIIFLQVLTSLGQTNNNNAAGNKWIFGAILYHEPAGTPNYFGGIIFKRQLKYFNIRSGIEYASHLDKTEKAGCCDQLSTEGFANEKLIRVGVEKGYILIKYFRPYAALDFGVIKKYSDIIYTGGFSGAANDRWITNVTSFGTMPTFGFEFLLTKNISAAIETRLQVLRSTQNYSIDNLNTADGPIERKEKKSVRNLDRISGLTLNVSF